LVLHSACDQRFEIQGSTDLVDWSALGTVTNTGGAVEYTDPLASIFPLRFYRAAQIP